MSGHYSDMMWHKSPLGTSRPRVVNSKGLKTDVAATAVGSVFGTFFSNAVLNRGECWVVEGEIACYDEIQEFLLCSDDEGVEGGDINKCGKLFDVMHDCMQKQKEES